MDKEERAKYDCVKDKENLEKKQKSGRSFLYMSQYGQKEALLFITLIAIEILLFSLFISSVETNENTILSNDKTNLVSQVDQYIKHDFKNMNCADKILFMDKYFNDITIYSHSEMKTWLHENFIDTCQTSKGN